MLGPDSAVLIVLTLISVSSLCVSACARVLCAQPNERRPILTTRGISTAVTLGSRRCVTMETKVAAYECRKRQLCEYEAMDAMYGMDDSFESHDADAFSTLKQIVDSIEVIRKCFARTGTLPFHVQTRTWLHFWNGVSCTRTFV